MSVGNFFFSIFSALITFILLPYLSLFIPTAYIGFVIAASAAVALSIFPFLPKLVERFGAQYIALALSFVEMLVLLALAGAPGAIASIILMILTIAVQPFLAYQFDILLEATIADTNTTGEIRALFRTAWSVAALAAPLLLGALLVNSNEYGRIFIAATAMFIPIVVLLATKRLPKGPSPKLYEMYGTLVHIWKHRDLAATTFANLLLYLFYVWMPLYTPVYLHSVLGISWADLGWIFSIMLVPYVLIEYPAGWIADRYLGDKELMLGGFIIAGGAAMTLAFVTPATPLFIILIILVVSRIGSALVEAMVEAHFFRRVSKQDIDSVSVFRAAWPMSYIIGPVIGSMILVFGNYQLFFILTGGFVALAGVITTLLIKDFK